MRIVAAPAKSNPKSMNVRYRLPMIQTLSKTTSEIKASQVYYDYIKFYFSMQDFKGKDLQEIRVNAAIGLQVSGSRRQVYYIV